MPTDMKITSSELRRSLDIVLRYLEEAGRSEFVIEDDYYWNVPAAELYEPYLEPPKLSFGQLSHDLERLESIWSGKDEPIGLALVWLGDVLKAIGNRSPI